jgi:hypothetical protein
MDVEMVFVTADKSVLRTVDMMVLQLAMLLVG